MGQQQGSALMPINRSSFGGPRWLKVGQAVESSARENPGQGAWADAEGLGDLPISLALLS